MEKLCRTGALLLCIILLAGLLSGCADFIRLEILGMDPAFVAYMDAPERYVIFRHDEENDPDNNHYLTIQELMDYESLLADCNSTFYRDQLTGEDLLMYNAFLYAMEHSYAYFELYVADNEKDFWFIRDALSLDTPLLEQNYNLEGETSWVWEDGKRIAFSVEQFTAQRWELKMQALEVCRSVVENIPDICMEPEQILLHLYMYVCDNMEYIDYEDNSNQDYLYDAVCRGKSNCDGYSNMLALLYNLAGFDCCETMGSDLEDPDNATDEQWEESDGHTWVVAKLDGNYYNFDPTYEDTTEDFHTDPPVYFRFSDELVDMKSYDCEALRPHCTDTAWDFDYVDLTVDNATDKAQIRKIANYTDNKTRWKTATTFVLVNTPVSDEAYDKLLDIYIDMVDNVSYVTTDCVDFPQCSVIRFVTEPW